MISKNNEKVSDSTVDLYLHLILHSFMYQGDDLVSLLSSQDLHITKQRESFGINATVKNYFLGMSFILCLP